MDPKYGVVYKPALIYEHVDVNLDNKLLADRRVRQAILLAIDRKAISEKLFEGKQPIAHSGISHLDPMFSQTARQYGYDAAAARKLLSRLDVGCWRHVCMGMNPLVMAALNGDGDSGCRAAR